MKKITSYLTGENVLSWALAFVVLWFGHAEITVPKAWVNFLPHFLGRGDFALHLVMVHGLVLTITGLALVFSVWRKWIAILVALIIGSIAVTLIWSGGLSAVAVRDIGLCGAAAALALIAWGRVTKSDTSG